MTKNSPRLELGMLQMVDPVPKPANCAESSAATLNHLVLLQVVASTKLSESLCVTQEWHLMNSCSRMFLVHF